MQIKHKCSCPWTWNTHSKAKNLPSLTHTHTFLLSYLGLMIESHHYLAMAVMRNTHLFSTAVPNHELSSFTLGPEALEVMSM